MRVGELFRRCSTIQPELTNDARVGSAAQRGSGSVWAAHDVQDKTR
jgi:hypothetical protein